MIFLFCHPGLLLWIDPDTFLLCDSVNAGLDVGQNTVSVEFIRSCCHDLADLAALADLQSGVYAVMQ